MKIPYALALALTILGASNAFACGRGGEPGTFKGTPNILNTVTRGEAHLACEQDGSYARAKLEIYAIYRCINSPVTVTVVQANGQKFPAEDLTGSAEDLTFHGPGQKHLRCRIEALSAAEQKALDEKRDAAKRAEEERKKKDEEEKAQVLASIPAEEIEKMFANIREQIGSQGYELESHELIFAWSSKTSSSKELEYYIVGKNKAGGKAAGQATASFKDNKLETVRIY